MIAVLYHTLPAVIIVVNTSYNAIEHNMVVDCLLMQEDVFVNNMH